MSTPKRRLLTICAARQMSASVTPSPWQNAPVRASGGKVAVRYRLNDANGELYDVRKQEFVNQAGQTIDREYFR